MRGFLLFQGQWDSKKHYEYKSWCKEWCISPWCDIEESSKYRSGHLSYTLDRGIVSHNLSDFFSCCLREERSNCRIERTHTKRKKYHPKEKPIRTLVEGESSKTNYKYHESKCKHLILIHILTYILHKPCLIENGCKSHHRHSISYLCRRKRESICIELSRHCLYRCESKGWAKREE